MTLSYDQFCTTYEDTILTELAETGADREMDFDLEKEFEKRYQDYKNNLIPSQ